ncbi:hypothetical protein M5K25_016585 [Dendrobium thyrsiflorum]|uniref:Uncharacterized protein n=1 Tax=Dendrobium thyrsiflorum TaxID=117978 RepID=A0ABD0UK25_DENTH
MIELNSFRRDLIAYLPSCEANTIFVLLNLGSWLLHSLESLNHKVEVWGERTPDVSLAAQLKQSLLSLFEAMYTTKQRHQLQEMGKEEALTLKSVGRKKKQRSWKKKEEGPIWNMPRGKKEADTGIPKPPQHRF